LLEARLLDVEVGGRLVVARASFSVRAGDKVGLVGRNGAGKTSLLEVLGGGAAPAGGRIVRQGALGYLSQAPPARGAGVEATALSHVLSGRGLDEAGQRLEKLLLVVEEDPSEANVARFGLAEEAYRGDGGYQAEADVARITAGLGLATGRVRGPLLGLSGGERRRVELARILFSGSDMLLLDEPTNHLDADAKAWLMTFLASYRGALVVVSHDLDLLDEAITRVLHLDREAVEGEGAIVEYRGSYSQYLAARRADEQRQSSLAQRQAAEITRLSAQADGMRHQSAKRARVAKSIDHRVERLRGAAVVGPTRRRAAAFGFPAPPKAGRVVLEVAGLAKAFGGPPVLAGVEVAVERGQRLLVMGLNGAGKTTLLRILAGVSSADSGTFRLGSGVSVGYYAQEHDGLVPEASAIDHLRERSGASEQESRALLGMFGLSGAVALQEAGTMSGGEKTKLALAQLVAGRHNLLLLDEPTNNLDPGAREAVAVSLAAWPGSMVVVSHDVDFVRALEPDLALVLPDNTVDRWSDDLADLVALA